MPKKTALQKLQESEKLLANELAKLRANIRAVKSGQNKRVKDANKYIAKTLKEIAKQRKEQEQIQEKELDKLEKFLGESFDTIKDARKAFAKQTKAPTERERLAYLQTEKKHALVSAEKASTSKQKRKLSRKVEQLEREITGAKLRPEKLKYKVRELSAKENKAVFDFLTDKKSFIDVGKGYLQPDERITISVPYRYKGLDGRMHTDHAIGRKIIHSWRDLQFYLMSYADEDSTEDWLGAIEIIKMPSSYSSSEHTINRAIDKDRTTKRKKEVKRHFEKKESAKRKEVKMKERAKGRAREAKLKEQIKQLKGRKK